MLLRDTDRRRRDFLGLVDESERREEDFRNVLRGEWDRSKVEDIWD